MLRRLLIEVADRSAEDLLFVESAVNAAAGLELIWKREPDVALIDISLPDFTGLELLRRAAASGTPTKLIVFTASLDPRTVIAAIALGAHGYINKGAPGEAFEIIRRVAAGERAISRRAREAIFQLREPDTPMIIPGPDELELLRLLAAGAAIGDAAKALVVSERRAVKMLERAEEKLGTPGLSGTVSAAVTLGLVPGPR